MYSFERASRISQLGPTPGRSEHASERALPHMPSAQRASQVDPRREPRHLPRCCVLRRLGGREVHELGKARVKRLMHWLGVSGLLPGNVATGRSSLLRHCRRLTSSSVTRCWASAAGVLRGPAHDRCHANASDNDVAESLFVSRENDLGRRGRRLEEEEEGGSSRHWAFHVLGQRLTIHPAG